MNKQTDKPRTTEGLHIAAPTKRQGIAGQREPIADNTDQRAALLMKTKRIKTTLRKVIGVQSLTLPINKRSK